jgi:hypothetical protein
MLYRSGIGLLAQQGGISMCLGCQSLVEDKGNFICTTSGELLASWNEPSNITDRDFFCPFKQEASDDWHLQTA